MEDKGKMSTMAADVRVVAAARAMRGRALRCIVSFFLFFFLIKRMCACGTVSSFDIWMICDMH